MALNGVLPGDVNGAKLFCLHDCPELGGWAPFVLAYWSSIPTDPEAYHKFLMFALYLDDETPSDLFARLDPSLTYAEVNYLKQLGHTFKIVKTHNAH